MHMSMREALLSAIVEPGFFSSERGVRFRVDGRSFSLLTHQTHTVGDAWLKVLVERTDGAYADVHLPDPSVASGTRVRVPVSMLRYDTPMQTAAA